MQIEGRIPKFDTVYKDCRIGSWLVLQRKTFQADKLNSERKEKLSKLGIILERKAR